MKKNIYILFGLSILATSTGFASPLDALIEAEKQIKDGEIKIGQSIKELKQAYIKTQNEVIDEIGNQVTQINKQHALLKTAYTTAEAVRDTLPASIPAMAATVFLAPLATVVTAMVPVFGDAPELIKSIRDTVGNITDTLNAVKDNIEPANNQLSPMADPAEVYYKLTKARVFMQKGGIILATINSKLQKLLVRAIATQKPTTTAKPQTPRITLTPAPASPPQPSK